jgi:hypothetical protein
MEEQTTRIENRVRGEEIGEEREELPCEGTIGEEG